MQAVAKISSTRVPLANAYLFICVLREPGFIFDPCAQFQSATFKAAPTPPKQAAIIIAESDSGGFPFSRSVWHESRPFRKMLRIKLSECCLENARDFGDCSQMIAGSLSPNRLAVVEPVGLGVLAAIVQSVACYGRTHSHETINLIAYAQATCAQRNPSYSP